MSAPAATIRRACSIAASGSRKRPPSENESGVTLSTPITSGRPCASSRPAGSGATAVARSELTEDGWASVMTVALRRSRERCQAGRPPETRRRRSAQSSPISDFQLQLLGVLDPPRHQVHGGQEADQLAP